MNFFENIGSKFKDNLKNILISFAIALGAWFFVSIQIFPMVEESVKNIPIEVQPTEYMIQNNLQIVSTLDQTVNIRIEGKRFDISGADASSFYASLDLSTVTAAGVFTVPVNVSQKTEHDCEIIDTDPLAVTIEIDKIISREFDITATAPSISLPDGYYVDEMTATPSTITVTGSASIIDKIDRIEARSAYNGAISESHETQSEIFIYGTNGARILNDALTLSSEHVSVYIPIYKQKVLPLTFSYANVPSNFDINSLKYRIQPSFLTVAAPDSSIDFISELDIGTIDLSDIKLDQIVSVPIALPDGYKNLSGNNTARIEWDLEAYGKLDFTTSNISIKNAPDNYAVSLITNEVIISVMGPSELLSALGPADLYVTADLLGVALRDGSQDVAVTVRIRGTDLKCWTSGSYKVTINAVPKTAEEE